MVEVSPPAELLGDLLESSLESGVEASFAVAGNSMRPLVRTGDVVRVRRLGPTEPGLGDVVAIRGMPDGGLLLHRVVRVRNGRLLLRGDNSLVDNGECPMDAVLGVLAGVERNGRQVWFGSGRLGWLVALAVRMGLVNYYNRVRLKFAQADSRLRERTGEDGNE